MGNVNLLGASVRMFLVVLVLMLVAGCNADTGLPIEALKGSMKNVPTYSIILENMKEEGNFIKSYFHKYRVVGIKDGYTTDWLKVPENYYRQNEQLLGMSLFSKKDDEIESNPAPPGYHFVGDQRYGQWQTDRHGNSFWAFYGQYRLLTDLMGGWYRPVYNTDFDTYRVFRKRKVPYFGTNQQYGSSGKVVKQVKPTFYERRMARQKASKASFSDKVAKRIGRTRTSFRSRSGSWGK